MLRMALQAGGNGCEPAQAAGQGYSPYYACITFEHILAFTCHYSQVNININAKQFSYTIITLRFPKLSLPAVYQFKLQWAAGWFMLVRILLGTSRHNWFVAAAPAARY